MPRARFCLVTSAHLARNPRLVKEADALAEAGYDVRVVAVDIEASLADVDSEMARGRRWRLARVVARRSAGPGGALRWSVDAALQRAALAVAAVGGSAVRDLALSRHVRALERVAVSEPADVVVAHNVDALPAAARAARRLGAKLAFDVEDLHTEDFLDVQANARRIGLIDSAERRYLPRCDLLLASSDGIGTAVQERYGVARPVTVLNAFPLAARAISPRTPRTRVDGRPSLYWFSQTLGPGRGIEDAVDAVAILRRGGLRVDLHLRSRAPAEFRSSIERRAAVAGVSDALHFWPPAAPDEMVALCAEHDVGLALEHPDSRNRALCVSNKILTYLAGGIPVAATDTPGQRAVVGEAPGAGFTYAPRDASSLARGLKSLVGSAAALASAKAAADAAARRRFCWEVESQALLTAYERLLGPSERPAGEAPSDAALRSASVG